MLVHALDLSSRGRHAATARILSRMADAGNAEAAAHLGWLIEVYGSFDATDVSASEWYEKAATGGSPLGAIRHAMELLHNEDPEPEEAARWLERGLSGLENDAKSGDAESQFQLAYIYGNGLGVPKDAKREFALLEQAVANGHLDACTSLASLYWDQPGRTDEEKDKAIELWRRAAEVGRRNTQYHLGVAFATNADMPIDLEQSIRYYRMAAENGDCEALYNLGTMYANGEGVTRDEAQGIALIVRAAEMGQILAQSYLSNTYAHGFHGCPVDEDEAAYWKARYDAAATGD